MCLRKWGAKRATDMLYLQNVGRIADIMSWQDTAIYWIIGRDPQCIELLPSVHCVWTCSYDDSFPRSSRCSINTLWQWIKCSSCAHAKALGCTHHMPESDWLRYRIFSWWKGARIFELVPTSWALSTTKYTVNVLKKVRSETRYRYAIPSKRREDCRYNVLTRYSHLLDNRPRSTMRRAIAESVHFVSICSCVNSLDAGVPEYLN